MSIHCLFVSFQRPLDLHNPSHPEFPTVILPQSDAAAVSGGGKLDALAIAASALTPMTSAASDSSDPLMITGKQQFQCGECLGSYWSSQVSSKAAECQLQLKCHSNVTSANYQNIILGVFRPLAASTLPPPRPGRHRRRRRRPGSSRTQRTSAGDKCGGYNCDSIRKNCHQMLISKC